MRAKTVDEEMAALREQHWSAEDAKRVLEACKDSGEAQAEFCRKHGLQPKRLSWWRRRLRDWGALRRSTDGVRFAPAVVPAATMQIKIRLPGEVTIEIADVGVTFVAALMSELRETAS
jgi:transposase-like protein